MNVTEYNKSVYLAKVREIAMKSHEVHNLIATAIRELEGAFPKESVSTPEWEALHEMMIGAGIVGSHAYRMLQPKPSIFGDKNAPPF